MASLFHSGDDFMLIDGPGTGTRVGSNPFSAVQFIMGFPHNDHRPSPHCHRKAPRYHWLLAPETLRPQPSKTSPETSEVDGYLCYLLAVGQQPWFMMMVLHFNHENQCWRTYHPGHHLTWTWWTSDKAMAKAGKVYLLLTVTLVDMMTHDDKSPALIAVHDPWKIMVLNNKRQTATNHQPTPTTTRIYNDG